MAKLQTKSAASECEIIRRIYQDIANTIRHILQTIPVRKTSILKNLVEPSGVSLNLESSHRFCETTAANCFCSDDVSVLLRKKLVVDLFTVCSNQLFDELAEWNQVLHDTNIGRYQSLSID